MPVYNRTLGSQQALHIRKNSLLGCNFYALCLLVKDIPYQKYYDTGSLNELSLDFHRFRNYIKLRKIDNYLKFLRPERYNINYLVAFHLPLATLTQVLLPTHLDLRHDLQPHLKAWQFNNHIKFDKIYRKCYQKTKCPDYTYINFDGQVFDLNNANNINIIQLQMVFYDSIDYLCRRQSSALQRYCADAILYT